MYFWFKDLLLFHYGAYTDMYLLVIFFNKFDYFWGLVSLQKIQCIFTSFRLMHYKHII